MKFKVLYLIIFLFFANALYSQHRVDLRGGAGISDVTGSDFSKVSKPKYGADVAICYEREFNPTISIVAELNYNQKGSNYEFYPREKTTVFVDIRSEYINIPILLKAYFGRKANVYLYGGLAYAKLLDHKLTHHAKEGEFDVSSDPFFPYKANSSDASLNFGFGFYAHRVFLDFRYQHSIQNIYEGVNSPSVRNHYLGVTVGLTVFHKKVLHCLGSGR